MRTLGAIRAIHTGFHPSDNEAQTEQDWIKPVLLALGHMFEVQPSLTVPGRPAEATALERRVAARVNEAYGLTAEEVALMWRTAPPRMPVGAGALT